MLYVWIAVCIVAIAAEILTKKWIAVWFLPSALVALIFVLCRMSVPAQIGVFLVMLLIGEMLFLVFIRERAAVCFEDAVGKRGTVIERVDNAAGCGLVKVNGQAYAARSISDEEIFEQGESLTVVAIEGVRLICRR